MSGRTSNVDALVAKIAPPELADVIVRRRDVVQMEIEDAIRLLLGHRRYVSAHLLTGAASTILQAVGNAADKTTSRAYYAKFFTERFGKEDAKAFQLFIDLPYNYFKHSTGNADHAIHFNPLFVEVSLWNTTRDFQTVFGPGTPLMEIYVKWFMGRHPHWHELPEANEMLARFKLDEMTDAQAYEFGKTLIQSHDAKP